MNGVQLREKGNALYKRGQLTEAIKAYQEATRRGEPDDYLPWSNLSAAYYEAGKYSESIQSALRALTICHNYDEVHGNEHGIKASVIAEQKLVPRMIRIYLHTHQFEAARQWLDRLPDVLSPSAIDDLRLYREALDHGEALWRAIPNERLYRSQLLRGLPRHRAALNAGQSSHKNINLDEVTDLVDFAVHSNIQRNLSVFLGGIGDARHFYSQLAILGVTERMSMQPATPLKRKYQFTLNDNGSDYAAVGRSLVLLVLLDELACLLDISQVERTEIYTTVYYIFAGVIMPRYALDRVLRTVDMLANRLRNNEPALPWLRFQDADRVNLIRTLESWKTDRFPTSAIIDRTVQSLYNASESCKSVYGLDDLPRAPSGCRKEFETYFQAPFLQGPRSIMREYEPELLRLIDTDASTEILRTYLTDNWCVNPTLLQAEDGHHLGQTNAFDVALTGNPFDVSRALYNIVSIQERGGPRKTKLFDYASSFFQMVVVSLRKIRGRLTVEYLLGDAAEIIGGIRHGLIDGRDIAAPTAFDLVYLSNHVASSCIPNVVNASSILNDSQSARLMISASRSELGLQEECDGDYLNANESETLFKATQMKLVARKEQCGSMSPLSDTCLLELRRERLAPFPYEQLLSRTELTRFVFTQFFKRIVPCNRCSSSSAHYSNSTAATSPNLTSFFDMLIHLHEIGYPAHWLTDILAKILGDGVNASPSPPRSPDEASHRSNITVCTTKATLRGMYGTTAPFFPEMSVLTTMYQRLLPFTAITNLPSPSNIFQYSMNIKLIPFSMESDNDRVSNMDLVLMLHNMHVYMPTTPTTILPFAEEGCIIITTFTNTPINDDNHGNDALVKFWMREDIMDQISNEETWLCTLLYVSDTSDDEWIPCTAQPTRIDSATKGRQWIGISSDKSGVDVHEMELDD